MRTVAVVLAGGTGQRFGSEMPKQMHVLAGRSLVEHSVAAFEQADAVEEIMVVMPAALTAQAREWFAGSGYRKVTGVIEGGAARTDSTRRAIAALGEEECDVLFHDAARPLLEQRIIAECVSALGAFSAVGVAGPASDTHSEPRDAGRRSMRRARTRRSLH